MPEPRPYAVFGVRFARDLWRLTRVYWTSAAARVGGLLLVLAVALELATVGANLFIADAERRIFDALGDHDMPGFFNSMAVFLAIVTGFVLVSTFRIYVRQILEIHWRERLTRHFLADWMGPHAYCQTELNPDAMDNPDQRIAEDIRNFVASALGLSLSLLAAGATLVSFGGLLWRMSRHWTVEMGGVHLHVPGFMLWVAIVYALLATVGTHLVGRPLVGINFDRLRFEADFRYDLVHFRDNVEAVALARGQDREQEIARGRFRNVVGNWWQLIGAQRDLLLFTNGIGQVNGLLPILIGAPAYFAGHLSLGSLAQTRIAYGQVSGALAWFVNAYQEIANWRASIERLATLSDAMEDTRAYLACEAGIRLEATEGDVLRLDDVRLDTPDGRVLIEHVDAEVHAGDRVVMLGPAGAGKTTLFRAIAGIWPFGAGRIEVPAHARMMFLTQRSYLPLGTLREALTYPQPGDAFSDARVRELLRFVDLTRLEPKLDQEDQWDQVLSGDERQRLVFARMLLHEPDWILADNVTANMDEAMEKRVYDIIEHRLPAATVVSISQRAPVLAHHQRRWNLVPTDGRLSLETA